MEEKFYYCDSCGNLAVMLVASGVTPKCCGKDMTRLVAKTDDSGQEKHVPVVKMEADSKLKVCVGSETHPMDKEHYIQFVCLQTSNGCVIRYLCPGDKPEVCFCFTGIPLAVYAYCNVHGLWRKDMKGCCEK